MGHERGIDCLVAAFAVHVAPVDIEARNNSLSDRAFHALQFPRNEIIGHSAATHGGHAEPAAGWYSRYLSAESDSDTSRGQLVSG